MENQSFLNATNDGRYGRYARNGKSNAIPKPKFFTRNERKYGTNEKIPTFDATTTTTTIYVPKSINDDGRYETTILTRKQKSKFLTIQRTKLKTK